MKVAADSVEKCIDAFLDGQPIAVPAEMESQYASAIAAHRALKDFLDTTADEWDLELLSRLPPKISADYDIERELGSGGMGIVYLARQRSLHRQIAIKVLRRGTSANRMQISRFLEEAKHLANLRHPNIVPVHEIGDAEGEPYFTMDFIDGEPLSAIIARGALTPSRAVAIARQVMLAVQHAHRQGVIHRDLKPGNVLVDQQGGVFVTDFGLARNLASDSNLTQTGDILGTPQYMSPEQARGDTKLIGEASDLHAIGLLLFEMLTGKPPFTASNTFEIVRKIASEEAPLLRKIDRRIPRDLETICLKCLQKAPANRYANATALLVDLQRYERGEPLVAQRPGVFHHAGKWAREHWKIAAAVLITASIAAGIAAAVIEKPYQELVAWGDEELAKGNAAMAATVYTRAFRQANETEKKELVGRVVETCKKLGDSKAAVDLAMLILPLAPEASFDKLDFLIAQALVTKRRVSKYQGGGNLWAGVPKEELNLVKSRLELALKQELTETQKREAEESFTAVNLALNEGEPFVRYTPAYLGKIPEGTTEALRKTLDDKNAHPWNRGRAAMALGKRFADEGEKEKALTEYETALKLMRSVYPMVEGIKAGHLTTGTPPDAEECKLVHQLVEEILALDPHSKLASSGTVELELQGYELPPTVGFSIGLELSEKTISSPDQGLPQSLPRLIQLQRGKPAKIKVLDGTYRVFKNSHNLMRDVAHESIIQRLQVDLDDWPKEIEVRDGVVKLPPIVLRVAEEVVYESPGNGDSVDLSTDELKWKALPNADHYKVQLNWRDDAASAAIHLFSVMKTTSNSLKFADLKGEDREQIKRFLTLGRTGGWKVFAHNANGKCIGVALEERWYLVAGELKE